VKKVDYKQMSNPNLNRFGKVKWSSGTQEEAILAATVARNLSIAVADIEAYAPFTRLFIWNKAAETIQVDIDGDALGDNSIIGSKVRVFLDSGQYLEITPEDNRDKTFTRIAITNTHAVNDTSAAEIVWKIGNF